ncbi:MAG: phosphate/phosphonate ABC transporter ATP-binding protein [Hyphomicrobiales bacterium]|nr:MAG: phosphate/phosphonate ABC transporter ATP-binding protein [Hyphomicrobiales bacterium]
MNNIVRTAISLADVNHHYPGVIQPSLTGFDFSVERGATIALIGPSGAGKSTLLALLDGRLRNWNGAVSVLGNSLDAHTAPSRADRAKTGFIFQEFALVERASVARNVMNGRLGHTGPVASLFGRFSQLDYDAVDEAMEDAGIAELADKRVDSLSGGQRQRVAIARCLAQEPELLLADEPISNLDPLSAEKTLKLLTQIRQKRDMTLVFSSHQPDLAKRFADRIIGIRAGAMAFDTCASDFTAEMYQDVYGTEAVADNALRLVG